MGFTMAIYKNGRQISTLKEWREFAPPKSPKHWSPGRSAMELARSWLAVSSPSLPAGISAVLGGHSAFGTILNWCAEPEVRISFDQLRGEPRNTDLLVQACDDRGEFLLAVEAKADEPFGETVAEALAAAAERRLANPRSRGIERIEHLAMALLGPRRKGEVSLGRIRYQLLTAVAGAVAVAVRKRSQRVVLLVQEFQTYKTTEEKRVANARDLNAFVHRLSHGAVRQIDAGTILGPFEIPGNILFGTVPPLFIGKVTCDLRTPGA
jgi:hypothetical protein